MAVADCHLGGARGRLRGLTLAPTLTLAPALTLALALAPNPNEVRSVGEQRVVKLVENMGANAIYSPALGSMPAKAAAQYLDDTFGN